MHMSVNPEGPSGLALASLTEEQRDFLISIPKAELHAHLNGSIPLPVLQELALERIRAQLAGEDDEVVKKGIEILENGVELKRIDDFFSLFPAIYSLTCDVKTLAKAASSVLHSFLTPSPEYSQCAYLELRTTPRETPTMTRRVYVETVLAEIEKFSADRAALIVAIDRRMTLNVTEECVDIAIDLRRRGGRVVGIDLCGDPTAGDMTLILPILSKAKSAGLALTLHIAETTANSAEETMALLSSLPSRLGHATFLGPEAEKFAAEHRMGIEICLSSNLLCKTVQSLDDHHILKWLKRADHPVAICTDDTLPFRTNLVAEYALLLAKPPLGLGLSEAEISRIAKSGFEARFH